MVIVSGFVAIYYNMILGWAIYYLFASFTSELPWKHCNPEWASKCEHTDSSKTKQCNKKNGINIDKKGIRCKFRALTILKNSKVYDTTFYLPNFRRQCLIVMFVQNGSCSLLFLVKNDAVELGTENYSHGV